MTEALVEKTCTPCRGGMPPLTRAEAEELLPQAPEWALMDDAHRIEKTFRFGNFREALAFVQRVGELAEAEGHHPDISFGWGYGTVSLRTKKIKGLHENDFIMAAKIDRLASTADIWRESILQWLPMPSWGSINLSALRGPHERWSDVILRLVEIEAKGRR